MDGAGRSWVRTIPASIRTEGTPSYMFGGKKSEMRNELHAFDFFPRAARRIPRRTYERYCL